MQRIGCRPIGVIRSGHAVQDKTPIQPVFAADCEGRVELLPDYAAGLEGVDGFSHLILLYHLDRQTEEKLRVKPLMGDHETGIFATRHPARPNHIGISIVTLVAVEGSTLRIRGCDILDGTPLLDIKPYVPKFDHIADCTGGWTDRIDAATAKQRGRREPDAPLAP